MENKLLASIPVSNGHSLQLRRPETAARPSRPSPAGLAFSPGSLKIGVCCPRGWRGEQKGAGAPGRVAEAAQLRLGEGGPARTLLRGQDPAACQGDAGSRGGSCSACCALGSAPPSRGSPAAPQPPAPPRPGCAPACPPSPPLPTAGAALEGGASPPADTGRVGSSRSTPQLSPRPPEALGARPLLPGQHKRSDPEKMMTVCFPPTPSRLPGIITLASFPLPPGKREALDLSNKGESLRTSCESLSRLIRGSPEVGALRKSTGYCKKLYPCKTKGCLLSPAENQDGRRSPVPCRRGAVRGLWRCRLRTERLLDFNLALSENVLLIPVVNFIMCHFPPLFGSKDGD